MFPQGDRHVLSSAPRMRAEPDLSIFDQPEGMVPPYALHQLGEGSDQTRYICGFIGCDFLPFNPLLNSLPRMIHIPDGYTRGDGWLKSLIDAIRQEAQGQRPARQSVLAKLSELLFIEVVRCYTESLPADATGWLAALVDPRISRAIHLLHNDPARPWTLDDLARDTGMSRTVLVSRFTEHLGVAPMTYLNNWRMQVAARMLMDQGSTIAITANAVGYESEAAFSGAFKRNMKVSPGSWRTRNSMIGKS